MKPAVIVVDMLVDTLHPGADTPVGRAGRAIVPAVQGLLAEARANGWPVVYANDSFLPGDAIFAGGLKAHALRGTPGAEVIAELAPQSGDFVLPKRRLSAFYKTDLDQTLRTLGVDTVAVCGITTTFCVLATALDALSLDLRVAIIEDCCAAHKGEVHEACLSLYRKNALGSLFQVQTARQFLDAASCR